MSDVRRIGTKGRKEEKVQLNQAGRASMQLQPSSFHFGVLLLTSLLSHRSLPSTDEGQQKGQHGRLLEGADHW